MNYILMSENIVALKIQIKEYWNGQWHKSIPSEDYYMGTVDEVFDNIEELMNRKSIHRHNPEFRLLIESRITENIPTIVVGSYIRNHYKTKINWSSVGLNVNA